ncbi:MAG: GPP34 family phosphoprotein [bacterium]
MNPPLTLVEEMVLLSLDDTTGAHLPLMPQAIGYGLAGAVLADLEMAGRIATRTKCVEILHAVPTGNPLLDPWLHRIASDARCHPIAYWLSVLSDEKREIENEALNHLIERGILKRQDKKILWVIGLRRYPTVHNEERVEVKTRLARLIQGEEMPSHFDATLISLLQGCCLISEVFGADLLDGRSTRLASIADADPVGREVAAATREAIEALMLAQSSTATPF